MARSFDGVDDRVVFGASASQYINTFTACAWVKFPSNFTAERQILTKFNSSYKGKLYLLSQGNNQNDLGVYLNRASHATPQRAFSVANTLTAGSWNFVCSTCDTTNAPKLYQSVAGSAAAECSYAIREVGAGAYDADATSSLIVGTRMTLDTLWIGEIAEVALWNRVLSADEIRALSLGFAPGHFPRGQVFYAPLIGRYSPEANLPPGGDTWGTVTGATVADHPRIIYPSQLQRFHRAISDVTVALTGISSTSAVGSFLPSHSVPTGGLSATGSIHTLGPSHTVVLTTNLGTSAVGTLVPSHAIALTTSLGTGEVGTLSPAFDFYAAITGVATTGEVGSVVQSRTIPLISQTLTVTPGTLAPSNVVPSSGSEATASVGSLAPAFSLPAATVVGTTGVGSLASSRTVPITGEAGTGGTGTVTGEVATIYQAITGVEATGAVGTPGVDVTVTLSGILVACSPGNLGSTGGTPDLPDYIYFHRPYVRQEGH